MSTTVLTEADVTNPEWKEADFDKAIPFDELPKTLQAKLRGRPKAAVTKERITIRLSADVLSNFRATGSGWQSRIDAALKEWLREHA